MTRGDLYYIAMLYWAGMLMFGVGYSLAWMRQDYPPSGWEKLATVGVCLLWPGVAVWAVWSLLRGWARGF